jgi:hypothetical protein
MLRNVRDDKLLDILCVLHLPFPGKVLEKKEGSKSLLPNTFIFIVLEPLLDACKCNTCSYFTYLHNKIIISN